MSDPRVLKWLAAALVAAGVTAYLSVATHAPAPDRAAARSDLAVIADIEAGRLTTPLVSPAGPGGRVDVTFYAKGEGDSAPRVISDISGWGERPDGTFDFGIGRMQPVSGSSWFRLSARAESAARIEYLFSYGAGDYRPDPHNPRTVERAGGVASEAVMPAYLDPPVFTDPPTAPAGRVSEAMVDGPGGPRRVIVYLPPGYGPLRKYPVIVVHDGALVVNRGEAPRVLDWLMAHERMRPAVVLFVEPASRADDYKAGAPMRDFVAGPLLAWASAEYSVSPLTTDRAIIGISAGARAALDAVGAHPGAFGRIGLLIPVAEQDVLLTLPERDPAAEPIDAVIVEAKYDALYRRHALEAARVLKSLGHRAALIEVAEGHSQATWRTHLADVLVRLFAR
jgi:enterochelin esterase-like enzyme